MAKCDKASRRIAGRIGKNDLLAQSIQRRRSTCHRSEILEQCLQACRVVSTNVRPLRLEQIEQHDGRQRVRDATTLELAEVEERLVIRVRRSWKNNASRIVESPGECRM